MNAKSPASENAFELLEPLGKGASGCVYKATLRRPLRDLIIGSSIAVKVIHPELLESAIVLGRLKREVEIGIRVRSRNIVSIYGVDKFRQYGQITLAIIMELIDGTPLKSLLMEKHFLSEELLLTIAKQVARGLQDIHALGIVHRDIKPANIIITDLRRVVLTDLGIARLPDISAKVTTTGTFIGTCAYASPEQFEDTDNLDPRSDLYSLGVVLYELATGINPFRSESLIASVQAHMKGLYSPPRIHNPKISLMLEQIILKLLARDREKRPHTATELLNMLDLFGKVDDTTEVDDSN